MRKIAMTLTAAAFALGSMALIANAQTQQAGAASLHGLARNATPIQHVACGGFGRWCGPGMRRVCGPARCWCAPC